MIRLSGTAADAAGAGQLQGSSGFGRRSPFRARRDGPDVPEKPVRRCFGQKVPGNGWAFANFFYLWRSKQYAMMDLKTIRAELRKLTAIVDGWEPSGEIPALERDLALEKLRTLYDAVRFTEVESLPESPVAETEPAAAPGPIDLGAVLSLDPTDEAVFEPGPDAVSGPAFDAEAEPAEPFSEPDTTVAADSAGAFAGGEPDTETPGMAEPAASDSEPELEGESGFEPDPEAASEAASEAAFVAGESEPVAESGPVAAPESEAVPEPSAKPVAAPESEAVSEPSAKPVAAPESEAAAEPSAKPVAAPGPAAAAEPVVVPEPAPAPAPEPAPAEKPQYIAPTLFGLEEETVRHRHKQRVIMSLYDTPAPAEKPARPETAERPAGRPEPAARPEPAVTLEPAARPEPAATPGPTVRPGFAATPEPAAAPASAGPGPQSGMSVPQSAAEPVTVSEAPAAAEPEEAESGAREVAVPVGAVLGEVINHDVQTLADTIAPRRDMASELRRGEPVADLRNAIGINDKFLLIRDLFGGDGEAYEEAIATLNAFDDFDECMIHIAENYAWNPNSDGAKFMMELLERKFA